ncbi:N-acetylmuramoyl-L-alanine amidase [Vibrio navarrensis]|uniref:1,6-anhydro-N-acetylmuramyl-L-alanine amidase AmpD n=1 Tax=Vibrio navarrensis TaxID=29495 RepID=UPI001869ABC7|nr:1,6-anhydro-N-acetylmuramyl-L-alanine amidase AmpD [Vibrio navarrensis]MBE4593538.1 N-acetylmuramoyl-L-alanine amidase [Vibrio navarrensis]
MQAVITHGWLQGVTHRPSPFYDARPAGEPISLLVIHNISLPPGEFGGSYIEDFFQGNLSPDLHPFFQVIAKMQVSAHCLIKRDGEIVQFVSFDDRAWHAGASSFAGVSRCNDYSIGIELEGTDFVAYTPEQYAALAQVSQTIIEHYPHITPSRITGHQYIAPLRKTDPGLSFDWRRYRAMLEDNGDL